MAKISAFVGHSFLPDDEAVVRKFTDFFDEIKRSHDFNWVHATEPRPDDVASKVLDLIKDRNLFIGICTPNERVAKAANFVTGFTGNFLKIKKDFVQTKTSDWIIQEIGLAIGRNMKVIILLQNGVRQPGSLQGNIEYIPFDRDAVEKSFAKILGMLTSLQGVVANSQHLLATQIEGTSSGEEHEVKQSNNLEDPSETWEADRFEFEHLMAVFRKDTNRAKHISDAWLARVNSIPEAVAVWESSRLLVETRYTDKNRISEIESIASQYPTNSKVQAFLARAYEHFGDYKRAKQFFHNSLENSENDSERRTTLAALARVHQKNQDNKGVQSTIEELRLLVKEPEDEKFLLSRLEEIAPWITLNNMLKLALIERELEIDPTDTHKRFLLAYAHSENDNNALTMYHYEQIPYSQRDPMTWNNLGVVYQGFSLPSLSVSAYQVAAKSGETLAMSNLAVTLMTAGFLSEAKDELLRAKDIDDAHKNVAKSQVRLDSILPNEEEKKNKLLDGAPKISKFLSSVGYSIWQSLPSDIGKTWSNTDVALVVSKEDDRVEAKGFYEKTKTENGLLSVLIGKSENSVDTVDVTISGRLIGCVLVGEYSEEPRGNKLKNLSLFPRKKEIIAVFDWEYRTLRCLVDKDLTEFEIGD